MKKDSDETMKMTRLDKNSREDKEKILENALSQGMIRKSLLKNPRYFLLIRRSRYLAYHSAKEKKKKEKTGQRPGISSISKYMEQLDPKKIFSN